MKVTMETEKTLKKEMCEIIQWVYGTVPNEITQLTLTLKKLTDNNRLGIKELINYEEIEKKMKLLSIDRQYRGGLFLSRYGDKILSTSEETKQSLHFLGSEPIEGNRERINKSMNEYIRIKTEASRAKKHETPKTLKEESMTEKLNKENNDFDINQIKESDNKMNENINKTHEEMKAEMKKLLHEEMKAEMKMLIHEEMKAEMKMMHEEMKAEIKMSHEEMKAEIKMLYEIIKELKDCQNVSRKRSQKK